MSTSTVPVRGPVIEPQDGCLRLARGVVPAWDRHAGQDAANDSLLPQVAVQVPIDMAAPAQGPNLGISAWFAISGTGMA